MNVREILKIVAQDAKHPTFIRMKNGFVDSDDAFKHLNATETRNPPDKRTQKRTELLQAFIPCFSIGDKVEVALPEDNGRKIIGKVLGYKLVPSKQNKSINRIVIAIKPDKRKNNVYIHIDPLEYIEKAEELFNLAIQKSTSPLTIRLMDKEEKLHFEFTNLSPNKARKK